MKDTQKRFPFYSFLASKFLEAELKKINDFVVLVRISPKVTIANYVHSAIFLVFFFFSLLSMLCVWAYLLLNKIPYLLLIFLWQHGWMLLAAIYTGYTIPPRFQPYSILFWLTIAMLIGLLWIAAQMKTAFRDLQGLRKMHTMRDGERTEFSLQRFLRLSLPMWLQSSVTYEPTPEEVLKILREREQETESQAQAIASTLVPDAGKNEDEQEESPSISKLLTLTHCATLSLLEPGGKRVAVELTDAVVPVVGFLGTREKGVATPKDDLLREVYDPGKEGSFGMHRTRAKKQILAQAQAAGFFSLKALEQKSQEPEDDADALTEDESTPSEGNVEKVFDLFEHEIRGQNSFWRLSSDCNVEIFPFMSAFYLKVVQAQALPLSDVPAILDLEQLRQGCHRVKEEYGDGFLASSMKKDGYVWSWALPLYKHYREQCLSILSYANQREREHLATCQTNKEKYDVIEHIAQLYGWQAFVATGLDLKERGVYSEHDMERCLYYYGKVQKKSAARAVYKQYCALRSQIDPTYEPGEALSQRAEEVLPSSRKASRSHTTS